MDFTKRFKAGTPISRMNSYPLMQATTRSHSMLTSNSVVRSEIQSLGWSRIAKDFGQEQQCILTMPLLEGLDGVENVESKNNYIAITEPANTMFAKRVFLTK